MTSDFPDLFQAGQPEEVSPPVEEALHRGEEPKPEPEASIEPTPPAEPEVPPQIRFRLVREELIKLERDKAEGKEVDLLLVQKLVNEAADLVRKITLSSTGPKKNTSGTKAEPKAKKTPVKKAAASTSANLAMLEDF